MAMQKLMPPKFRPATLADDPMATGAEVDRVFAQLSDLIYVSADVKVGESLQIGYDGACIEVQILFASERDHQLAWVVGIPALRCGVLLALVDAGDRCIILLQNWHFNSLSISLYVSLYLSIYLSFSLPLSRSFCFSLPPSHFRS